jgi:protein-S-isoprenylcysteine O-methyltransferase Ste14
VNLTAALAGSPLWVQPPLVIVANLAVTLAFVLISAAIVWDFVRYHRQDERVVSTDRSLVETGSMTAFFLVYYLVIRFRVLELGLPGGVREVLMAIGLVLVAVGVGFNIWGRVVLGSSWANQIRIYEGQRLLTSGPFAIVRHPLYASLIWTFVGGSLIYANPLSLALTAGVFVPMMYVRAKKEDAVLLQNFTGEYGPYRARTGMFFPKAWR